MFAVTLYTFSKEVNSTRRPSGQGATYNCQSNADFDIINPRIPLAMAAGSAANPSAYNYMYVPAWNRYYWINRWAWEGGLWTAYGSVDALASWKTEIGATSAYILRAAAEKDGSVIDNLYPQTANVTSVLQTVDSPWDLNPENGSFIVGIVGSGATQYLRFGYNALNLFLQYILSDAYAIDAIGALSLSTNPELKAVLDPLQYISTIVWLPFGAVNGSPVTTVRVGYVDVSVAAYTLGNGYESGHASFTVRRHPKAGTLGSWTNAALTDYRLYFPPFGTINIDPLLAAKATTIHCDFRVDCRTGRATLGLTTDSAFLCQVSGQVGIPWQIGQTVAAGYGASQLLTGALSTGLSIVAGNVPGAITGGLGMIGDAARAKVPSTNTVGGTGGVDGLVGNLSLVYDYHDIVDVDNTHRGSPLCAVRTISALSGYILCSDVELTIPCTAEESAQIKDYMERGFFYA